VSWEDLLISASEISAFEQCKRLWAFGYIEGIRGPTKPSAALGTEVDDEQIQPYLREGRPFDFTKPSGSGEIAASMVHLLPQPGTVEIQRKILMPSPTWIGGKHVGFGYLGFADIFAADSSLIPGAPGGAPGIGDTKTSVDIVKWGKTAKSLLVDTQAMLYATDAMFKTGSRVVDLAWIYGQTKKPRKAHTIHVRVGAAHVAEQFERINGIALEMLPLRRELLSRPDSSPLELEPSPDACENFGGCFHRDTCNLSPIQIMEAAASKAQRRLPVLKEEKFDMSNDATNAMVARLKAQAAARAGGAPPAAPATPPATGTVQMQPPPAPPSLGSLFAPPAPPQPPPAPPAATGPINPPESALPPAPPVGSVPVAPPATRAAVAMPSSAGGTVQVAPPPQTVRVVWGEEKFFPIKFDSFTVGPFEATGVVQPGESVASAMARVYAELAAFAEEQRLQKLASFAGILQQLPAAKS